ncbi:hypothetical protein KHQ08_00695 (plasmid) [Pseudochrobactrum algeriensis]|uniref:hypothetical protein n=1 Tax=Pseudochrobactrum algeriensis TaxID=2834768 RepID=UPI001BCC3032|nr:hypothetical protein [Pseudochrobactrum algeriensis]QVQ35446.1 hypothetical protein KHQ08_00695 [Pseudochrobactrum algeriensis]QVQ42062.1 hypothetical protein KHQ07_16565 [Pseudochrobactrum algeriensis]QVQ42320.1 hypothetical protein KHQ09_01360 [Pseudochrobactrum algeriensis]
MSGDIVITKDGIYDNFGKALNVAGDGKAKRIFANALNRGGDMARTQVKRSLVSQTGIKYGLINKAVETKRANPNKLSYSLEATGNEMNLNLFAARQGKKGVSAAPWKQRRVFKSTFIVPAYDGKVYKRTSPERGPVEPLFGPNIAREITKDPTVAKWKQVDGFTMKRVEHELIRLFKW